MPIEQRPGTNVSRITHLESPEGERETDVITSTITLLRKIRGFPTSLYIGEPAYTPAQIQQFLLDVELIGLSTADLLIPPPDGETAHEEEV